MAHFHFFTNDNIQAEGHNEESKPGSPRRTGLEIYQALTRMELPSDYPDDIPDKPAETREGF